jgi:hypothetical protein
MHRLALVILLAACGSKKSENAPAPVPSPVERGTDPWAASDTPPGEPGPAAKNLNKLVIGGDNQKPQMGLFALSPDDARDVDAAMRQGLEPAYRLAQQRAVQAWAGDRNFCEDAVRQTIGYFGIDGMLDPKDLKRWKTASLDDVRAKHGKAINELHFQMIGERDEAACDRTLGVYVEGLKLAAAKDLELRNFGY